LTFSARLSKLLAQSGNSHFKTGFASVLAAKALKLKQLPDF
jgi:hypothetical protein